MRYPSLGVRKRDLVFYAGLSRLGVGLIALVLFTAIGGRARHDAWILWPYLGFAAIEQLLIRKQVGGRVRSFLAGLVDGAVVTFFTHRLGSVAGSMSGLYVLAAVLNTLVVGRRVGLTLSAIYAGSFLGVVWLERSGSLPFAPDVPELAVLGRPPLDACVVSSLVVVTMLIASVTVVGALVHALDKRERELASANSHLEELSQRDPLTGLANRRQLFDTLGALLGGARGGAPLSVVMLDLDGFKQINDSEGHLRGDVMLVEMAEAMRGATRAHDVVGRYGGDEFSIVLPDTNATDALGVAERVVSAVSAVGRKFGGRRCVTASVGVAEALPDDSVASLTRRADEACYRAKSAGGDRVVAA
jgi:diguanylate cyclase (GGDEF)-like protein